MTVDEIRMRVAAVGANRANASFAREIEEALWFDTLMAIARGETTDPVECAKAAIETQQFWRGRWVRPEQEYYYGRNFPLWQ